MLKQIRDKFRCPDCKATFWIHPLETQECPECGCRVTDEDWIDREETEMANHEEMVRLTRHRR